jgi:hypothetical protein
MAEPRLRFPARHMRLPGYVARLAGILHVLDWAFRGDRDGLPDIVQECHLAASLVLIENYFVPQIVRAYHGADLSPAEATAAAILQHCRKEQLTEFNLRDARRAWGISGARGRDACKRFDEAATLLGTAGWIRPLTRNGGAKDFELNPALYSRGEA